MAQRPCCVANCDDKAARRYVIPPVERLREIWVQRVGNPKLLDTKDRSFLGNYRVCANHFADICRDASGRLLPFSLPTLKLPGYVPSLRRENCFSYPEESAKFKTPQKIREVLRKNLEVKIPIATYSQKRSTRSSALRANQSEYQPVASKSSVSGISSTPDTIPLSGTPSPSAKMNLSCVYIDEPRPSITNVPDEEVENNIKEEPQEQNTQSTNVAEEEIQSSSTKNESVAFSRAATPQHVTTGSKTPRIAPKRVKKADGILDIVAQKLQAPVETPKEFDNFAKHIAEQMRQVSKDQVIFLTKIINDAIFEAQCGTLTKNSRIVANSTGF